MNEPAYRVLVSTMASQDVGISIVLLYDRIDQFPFECSVIIDGQDQYLLLFSLSSEFPSTESITFDHIDLRSAYEASRALSGIFLNEVDRKSGLPKSVTFLDMFDTDSTDNLNIYRRWLQNRSFESMKAAVGVNGSGKPFYLDIHEKHHGPHGLVAGTTGSGKSEFLQTYILSMALSYHPNEVAFLLIDYKGGDMANFFESLPHTAGVITNLGGNQTSRALASIKAEVANRQHVFKRHQVRHIDEYIELFRLSKVSEPLPHMIIIADEFAELKKDNPEFIRELISASRIGRSLGIHLILATQQASTAVDGEIRANSKFGVCLRVNDKHESTNMVGHPDASFIQPSQIGRGFFQVGNDDIFEEFQSAWSGAPYNPGKRGDGISKLAAMVNLQGKPCVIRDVNDAEQDKSETEISAIVKAIIETAFKNNVIRVRSTWIAPLPKLLTLDAIDTAAATSGNLSAALGLADEPSAQRQSSVIIDIMQTGHVLICGGPLSGKTTLVETLLTSLAKKYSPKRLHIYIADYNSRLLSVFSGLPHVGGVISGSDADKTEKLIKLALGFVSDRKRIYAEKGVGTYRDYTRTEDGLPAIIFVIDGLPEFVEANPKLDDALLTLAKEGASLGVYIIATCGGMNEIKGRLKNYFTFNIGLGLADKFEYSQTLGERCEIAAEKNIPGRGMIKCPAPVEFQTAIPVTAAPERFMIKLAALIKTLAGEYGASDVKRIPAVPEKPDYLGFISDCDSHHQRSADALPLGYDIDEAEIVSIDLKQTFCYAICGQQRTGKTNALKLLIRQCKENGAIVALFDETASPLASFAESVGINDYFTGTDGLYRFSKEVLIPEFTMRSMKNGQRDKPIFVFIHNLIAFTESVYSDEYPMSGFFEAIFNTGAGLNMYFIGSLLVTGINDRLYPAALKNYLSWYTGLYLGGKVSEQNIYDFDMPLSETFRKSPAGVGYTLVGGQTVKIRIPLVQERK
jgi:S-DNA-T family DNA segregation ATPase FtsK/SpoIIIE